MYCNKCGKELTDEAKFCQNCGSPVLSVNKAERKSKVDFQRIIGKLKSKKGAIIGAVILCLIIVFIVIISTTKTVEEKSVEEHLLGEWIAGNENGEASIAFRQNGDKYIGEWTVYDYSNKEWEELNFTIKETDGYVMTILFDNGEMEYVPFAVSKDTLIFADTEYKNKDKNVPIPTDKYTYILDGVMRPVTMSCYMGMTKDEVDNAMPYTPYITDDDCYYYDLPENEYGDIRLWLNFDEKYGLNDITYWPGEEYYDNKSGIIEFLSDLYGDYTKEQWSTQETYYSYTWHSGNLVIELNDDTEDNTLWIHYSIDRDWFWEFKKNNKD